MTETQERFLRTVLAQVPLETVVELHLFPPIRRGTLETGVAVVVTELPVEVAPSIVLLDVTDHPPVALEDASFEESALDGADSAPRDDDDALVLAVSDEPADAVAIAEPVEDAEPVDAVVAALPLEAEATESDVIVSQQDGDDDSPYAAEETEPADDVPPQEFSADDEVVIATTPAVAPRMRISTASYRHTIKGVERGKWSVEVQEEADAPLEAVEAVLRGVRHRSTEPADPELVTREQLEHLVAPAVVAPAA